MTKASIKRLFTGSVIAVLGGAVIGGSAVALAAWSHVFVMSGADVTGIHGGVGAWSLLGLGVVGMTAIAAGLVGGLASWIGALIVTWQRQTRTWFAVLILLGIFNLGFFGMIAYLVAGPDRAGRTGQVATESVG